MLYDGVRKTFAHINRTLFQCRYMQLNNNEACVYLNICTYTRISHQALLFLSEMQTPTNIYVLIECIELLPLCQKIYVKHAIFSQVYMYTHGGEEERERECVVWQINKYRNGSIVSIEFRMP